jgi:hypothetical protein
MHGDLETAGQRLAQLVASHEQSLAVSCASGMEGALLFVRSIMRKAVFD